MGVVMPNLLIPAMQRLIRNSVGKKGMWQPTK